jgi:RimJ/RimL family protein N-acetyltransferase
MISLERTTDATLVRKILTHPSIFPWVTDDSTVVLDEEPDKIPDLVWCVVAREDTDVLGLVTFIPQNAVCWDVHLAFLPCAWGAKAKEAIDRAFRFIAQQTTCRRLVGSVPVYNRLAIAAAKRAGMQQFGINEQSFLKDGRLWDQAVLGMNISAEG